MLSPHDPDERDRKPGLRWVPSCKTAALEVSFAGFMLDRGSGVSMERDGLRCHSVGSPGQWRDRRDDPDAGTRANPNGEQSVAL
jgi:hypothetical protein